MKVREIMRRLGTGERWWAAEIVIRTIGTACLALCTLAAWWLYRDAQALRTYEVTPYEWMAAAFAFLCWTVGGAFAVQGPALFKLVPIPGRHASFVENFDDRPDLVGRGGGPVPADAGLHPPVRRGVRAR